MGAALGAVALTLPAPKDGVSGASVGVSGASAGVYNASTADPKAAGSRFRKFIVTEANDTNGRGTTPATTTTTTPATTTTATARRRDDHDDDDDI